MAKNKKHKRRNNKKKKQQISTADLLQNTILYQQKSDEEIKVESTATLDEISTTPQQDIKIEEQDDENAQNQTVNNIVRTIPANRNRAITSTTDALKQVAQLDQGELELLKRSMGDTFNEIMSKFGASDDTDKSAEAMQDVDSDKEEWEADSENEFMDSDEEDDFDFSAHRGNDDEQDDAEKILSKLSRKKLKRLAKFSVAELKQYTTRPEVVEAHDENAPDPLLLVHLKSCRNTVPVPKHWSDDRKYLSSKRGYEKPPFELPDFIKSTGIQEIREKYEKKMEERSAKTRARDRMRAKLSKTDIDYQILHDAFFKYQKKPPLTIHGDTYFEGKEHQMNAKQFKLGELSQELRNALGLPEGAPPPWLIHMQKHGPPPSYPYLKIPGLNAPIPQGAKWGFHPGGWGRPPLDAQGKPLYGDVFGTGGSAQEQRKIVHEHWGQILYDDDEDEEDESEDEEMEEADQETKRESTTVAAPTRTDEIRNNMVATVTTEVTNRPKQLFTVLQEERVSTVDEEGILNTQRKYIIPDEYMRQSAPNAPQIAVEHQKTDMELEQEDFMAQKEEQRKEYAATDEDKQLALEESRKRKRKDQEKERARKKFKL